MTDYQAYTSEEIQSFGLHRERLPFHVAFIMDGNGRWAVAQDLPRVEGHRKGAESARMVIEESARLGLQQITLFCLSSENWKRPAEELELLFQLLKEYLINERSTVVDHNLRFAVIGRREGLPDDVLNELDITSDAARGNTGMCVCLAINYGSRAEISDAAQRIALQVANGELNPNEINEGLVSKALDTGGMPDPDLVIRTAGEMRLSNFLLYQLSYAELYVTERCWPDFDQETYFHALRDFTNRKRRFGGLNT